MYDCRDMLQFDQREFTKKTLRWERGFVPMFTYRIYILMNMKHKTEVFGTNLLTYFMKYIVNLHWDHGMVRKLCTL
jgi:hypothetical protein